MQEEKNKWVNKVFNSLERSHRASPKSDLFAKIEHEIIAQDLKIISIRHWRLIAAAAVLLAILNIITLQQYTSNSFLSDSETTLDTPEIIISNYKLYE